jgi:hypothetical protein
MADAPLYIEPMPNPFSEARKSLSPLFDAAGRYIVIPATIIPGTMLAMIAWLVAIVCIVLWPYGFLPVLADLLVQSIRLTTREFSKIDNPFARLPFAITVLLYALILVPVAYLCFPFFMLWLAVAAIEEILKAEDWGKVAVTVLAFAVGEAALLFSFVFVGSLLFHWVA